MDDAFLVHGLESLGDLSRDRDYIGHDVGRVQRRKELRFAGEAPRPGHSCETAGLYAHLARHGHALVTLSTTAIYPET